MKNRGIITACYLQGASALKNYALMDKDREIIDLKAIEHLYNVDYKSLCNTAHRIVNDWDTSQDVVQEVFIKLWKKRKELTIESTLRGYVFKAVLNASLNYLENNKRILQFRDSITEEHISGLTVASDQMEEKELQARIEQALDRLPPKCRTIFILSKFEGMKYRQIAEHLNLSVKTVENQMGIALQKLREDLKVYASREFLVVPLLLILFSYC